MKKDTRSPETCSLQTVAWPEAAAMGPHRASSQGRDRLKRVFCGIRGVDIDSTRCTPRVWDPGPRAGFGNALLGILPSA